MEQYPLPEKDYMVLIRCYTYNHEKYIEDALKGFIMQKTNFPFVAVIVDDASTDGTADIIRKYEALYPEIIKGIYLKENHYSQKKPKSVYIAPWRERCRYEALCEGDDYWIDSSKLQTQVDFLEIHNDYVLSYTNKNVVDESNKKILVNNQKGKNGNLFNYLLFIGNPITTASVCYRISIYQKAIEILRKEKLTGLLMGDFQLWITMSTMGYFKYESKKMVVYRILQNSASHSINPLYIDSFYKQELKIKVQLYQKFKGDVSQELYRKLELKYYKTIIRKMANYDRSIFLRYYKDGITHYPQLILSPKLAFFFLSKFIKL